ncbi:outer membrane lipoprotein-sorting protein [Deltaproteobacteria bacterium TL4]
MNKTLWLITGLALFAYSHTALALTPKEIVQKVDKRDDGNTSISEMTMILIDEQEQQRVRKLKGFRKDYGDDKKSLNFFLEPADVKNTVFLSFDWDDPSKEDDSWLYLPALRKVKRIAAGNKKDSFMGTDFSYHDMNGLEIEDWDYQLIKEADTLDGQDCWVIGSTPKKAKAQVVIKDTGYVKRLAWIRKDIFMAIQAKIWVKKGEKIKILRATEITQVQGLWTAKKVEMSTYVQNKREHSTVLLFDNIKYNEGVEDDLFSTTRMEKGL